MTARLTGWNVRKILEILWIDRKESKAGKTYWKTTALLDDGTEATGFGKEFKMEDPVEVFFHYGQIKMRKRNG